MQTPVYQEHYPALGVRVYGDPGGDRLAVCRVCGEPIPATYAECPRCRRETARRARWQARRRANGGRR